MQGLRGQALQHLHQGIGVLAWAIHLHVGGDEVHLQGLFHVALNKQVQGLGQRGENDEFVDHVHNLSQSQVVACLQWRALPYEVVHVMVLKW